MSETESTPPASHWTSWPPMDDGPVLTDEEQMALVTAVRVQQVAHAAVIAASSGSARVSHNDAVDRSRRPTRYTVAGRQPPEERLSAEEREALDYAHFATDCTFEDVVDTVERILAAHLADVEARLAAVEALVRELGQHPTMAEWHVAFVRTLHPSQERNAT